MSRTAVSKWESGKGYPNIESLKSISRLFSVTIDDLLSGEELISLAADENLANINKFYTLIYAILDLMMLVFLFLPLYGQEKEGMIRMVSLFSNPDANAPDMDNLFYLSYSHGNYGYCTADCFLFFI